MILGGLLAGLVGHAQSLEGDWFYRGIYAEGRGGPQKQYDQNFDAGTMSFEETGEGAYRVTVVDPEETQVLDLTLERVGDIYSGVLPTDSEPNATVREEVRITLHGEYASLVSLTWRTSNEAGLEGQSFEGSSAVYILSRSAFPSQSLVGFEGEYAYRLNGQAAVFEESDRRALVDIPSISMREVGGFIQANYQGSTLSYDVIMGSDPLGVAGETTRALAGVAVNTGAVQIDRHELRRYAMAVQLNDTDVAWMQFAVQMGTVNSGTTNQYYTLISVSAVAGVAERTIASRPEFTRNLPAEVAVLAGGDLFLSAEVTGVPTPQYQWYLSTTTDMPSFEPILATDTRFEFDSINNTSLSSTPTLVLREVTPAMDGYQFEVEAINASGGTQSVPTTLKVLAAPTARLPNLSVRTTLASAQTLAVGFVMTGGSKPLLVRAIGPTLGSFGVAGVMPDPRLGFNNASGVEIDANDDWSASLATTFGELGAFALDDGSKDAALRVDLSGLGTVSVNGPEGGTVLVEVYDIGESNETRLANVSARNQVGTGNDILIAGFVVSGDDPKNMLIRAVGPGLANYGITGYLGDPLLKIYKSDPADPNNALLVASNDNWSLGLKSSFQKTGAFDLTSLSLDAALVVTLEPGAYTAQVSGADGGIGEALVEIYELP
ncbi:immunoglobulin domain-containing protein [Synoicihabitans lomoniglobus]|uniref:Immunoglobulin domain-containing protein n=1 Tax=Synoicihabitans lomoniglobus TaxID=2909285 RepID=A0AAE9ZUR6_9BACT|nr:immunoglobulin domain-containing protein [Opitutaceae bacterium LMO-M01]WED63444.1 immunoglobulin domain-containing protein [Opitutaceae bacterium LMO-M01]